MARTNKRKLSAVVSSDPVGQPYTPSETPDDSVAAGTVAYDMSPFVLDWVKNANQPTPKKAKKTGKKQDVSEPKEEEGITGSGLSGLYTVTPGTHWNELRKYRNFVVNPNNEPKVDSKHKFEIGQYVFVNHSETPNALVMNDKESWVAQVKEVRAEGQHAVYVRVLWFYWPDELPAGREYYHGEKELIASNFHQIIDAMTVSGKATVHHVQNVHDMGDVPVDALYWRQTLDIRKKPLRCSPLTKECICKTVTSPDALAVRCPNDGCYKWQHERCLTDRTLALHWDERGSKLEKVDKDVPSTNGKTHASDEDSEMSDTIEATQKGGLMRGISRTLIGALTGGSGSSGDKSSRPANGKKAARNSKPEALAGDQPWAGSITAKLQIRKNAEGSSEFNGKATIYRVSSSKTGDQVLTDFDDMEVACLFCGKSMVESEETPEPDEAEEENLDPGLFVSSLMDETGTPQSKKANGSARPIPGYDAVREAAAEHASTGEGDGISGSE